MPYDRTGSTEDVLSTSKEEEQIDKTNVTATETEVEFSEEVKAMIKKALGGELPVKEKGMQP